MNIWIKPNGIKLPVNENSAEYARSLGWRPEGESVPTQSGDKFDGMDKSKLEEYAKENYDIDLDKRRGVESLRDQVRALENGDV